MKEITLTNWARGNYGACQGNTDPDHQIGGINDPGVAQLFPSHVGMMGENFGSTIASSVFFFRGTVQDYVLLCCASRMQIVADEGVAAMRRRLARSGLRIAWFARAATS